MKRLSENDILNLVIKAKNQDRHAINELLEYENAFLNSLYMKLNIPADDIADIIQGVLFKVSKNIGKLNTPKTYPAWVRRIAMNQFYDYLRQKKNIALKTVELTEKTSNIPDYTTNPYRIAVNSELDNLIKQSIQALPHDFKRVIIMRELAGLSYDKIAKISNVSLGTVKSRISRARNCMKKSLQPYLSEK